MKKTSSSPSAPSRVIVDLSVLPQKQHHLPPDHGIRTPILVNGRPAFGKWTPYPEASSGTAPLSRNRPRRSFDFDLLSKFDFAIQKGPFYWRNLTISIIYGIVRDKCRDKVMIRCETCNFGGIIFHISVISYQSIYPSTHLPRTWPGDLACRSNRKTEDFEAWYDCDTDSAILCY